MYAVRDPGRDKLVERYAELPVSLVIYVVDRVRKGGRVDGRKIVGGIVKVGKGRLSLLCLYLSGGRSVVAGGLEVGELTWLRHFG